MNELFALVLYSRGKYTDMPSLQCDYGMRVYGLLQSLRSKIELDKLSKLRIVKDTFEIRGIYAILYMIKFFKAVAPLLSFIALEVGISRKAADTSVRDVSAALFLCYRCINTIRFSGFIIFLVLPSGSTSHLYNDFRL